MFVKSKLRQKANSLEIIRWSIYENTKGTIERYLFTYLTVASARNKGKETTIATTNK